MTDLPIEGCTVGELLTRATAAFGDRDAVVSPERDVRWSFRELDAHADRVASACRAAGLKKGDRAVVWCVNIPEWIALQYGLARAGVVLVTANTNFKEEEITFILEKSRARALFFGRGNADNDFAATVDRLDHARLPHLERLVGLDGAGAAGSAPFDEFLAAAGDAAPPASVEFDRDDVINMQYTSGTTGFPKGVMLTHRNIVQNAAAMARALGLGPGDRLCLTVPLFHCFGCVIGTLVAHETGTALVLNDVFKTDAILDTIEAERCTAAYGVPTMFVAELEAQKKQPRDLGSLRVGVMAGSSCPPQLMREVMEKMVPGLVVAYGLTEASPGVTISRPDDDVELRATTVGRAIPDVEVRIVDPATGEDVPDGERGELWARGENIMVGYDGEPDATRATVTADGWLKTGDLALRRDDGCYQVVGRIKDLIIRGGENISPAEIEDVLRRHPAVIDAAAFAIPHDFFGEVPAAAVRIDGDVTEDELKDHVRSTLADHKTPEKILFLQQFPLTGSGKVQRFKLQELIRG